MGIYNAIEKRLLCLIQAYKTKFYNSLIFKEKNKLTSQGSALKQRFFDINLTLHALLRNICSFVALLLPLWLFHTRIQRRVPC